MDWDWGRFVLVVILITSAYFAADGLHKYRVDPEPKARHLRWGILWLAVILRVVVELGATVEGR